MLPKVILIILVGNVVWLFFVIRAAIKFSHYDSTLKKKKWKGHHDAKRYQQS
jgi:hypothetical protein